MRRHHIITLSLAVLLALTLMPETADAGKVLRWLQDRLDQQAAVYEYRAVEYGAVRPRDKAIRWVQGRVDQRKAVYDEVVAAHSRTDTPVAPRYSNYEAAQPQSLQRDFGTPTFAWGNFGAASRPTVVISHKGYYGDSSRWQYHSGR